MTEIRAEITETFPVLRYTASIQERLECIVAREYSLTIVLNNRELATMLCTPGQLDCLTAGFLSSEGFINNRDEVKDLQVDESMGVARLETLEDLVVDRDILHKRVVSIGGGRGSAFYHTSDLDECKVTADTTLSVREILTLAGQFQHASSVYDDTHGVHSAALSSGSQIMVYAEDIGRHNAVDKVFGRCFLDGIATEGLTLLTSGRISTELVRKATYRGIPIIISIAVPTNLAVRFAEKIGITLVTSVRGGKMDVYTHGERITGG